MMKPLPVATVLFLVAAGCASLADGLLVPVAMSSCRNAPVDSLRETGATSREIRVDRARIDQVARECELELTPAERTVEVYLEPNGDVLDRIVLDPGESLRISVAHCRDLWCEIRLEDGRKAWVVDGWPDMYLRLE